MRTIMTRSPRKPSFSFFSFSKKHFHRIIRKTVRRPEEENGQEEEDDETLSFTSSLSWYFKEEEEEEEAAREAMNNKKRASSKTVVVSRFRSVLTAVIAKKNRPPGLGNYVTGTLFGYRRGRALLAFQVDSKLCPVVLIELATTIGSLVRELASGLVRIALECEKVADTKKKKRNGTAVRLVEEPLWRMYCNGKKCGYAVRRECGPDNWRVLRAVEPVSMGAGVLPGDYGGGPEEGDVMYMRARFERVVSSRYSEALYMMHPDRDSGPELSIYLIRV